MMGKWHNNFIVFRMWGEAHECGEGERRAHNVYDSEGRTKKSWWFIRAAWNF